MTRPNPPITRWTADGITVVTVGFAATPSGGHRLVGLAHDGTHYVADQDRAGHLTVLVGPVSPGHAVDVAARVLAGMERTVSDVDLIMASAIVLARAVSELAGCAAAGEVAP